ncbi:hypothetical protein EV426DRAFT_717743 [Tirmania nivea]|nr:hypothetical protein EV426DRAFT_717743 [Tirmania nivea]
MLFEEGDAALLKKWIVKRLEDISDADSDVLADYVLALLRHEQGEEEVKSLCVEQLDDFLREHTRNFVHDVFAALRSKSFLSVNSTLSGGGGVVQSPPATPVTPNLQQLPREPQPQQSKQEDIDGAAPPCAGEPRGMHSPPVQGQGHGGQGYQQNHHRNNQNNNHTERGQKRPYYDRDRDGGRGAGDIQCTPNSTSSRGFKAPRRGGDRGGANAGRWTRGGAAMGAASPPAGVGLPFPNPATATSSFGAPPAVPGLSTGFPWPEDPMAALLAMQAWTGMAGFSPIPPPSAPVPKDAAVPSTGAGAQRKPVERKIGERCNDYDEKGYCMQGDMCPYEHGMDHIVISEGGSNDEYDPNNSQLFPTASTPSIHLNGSDRGRGDRGRGRGGGRGRGAGVGVCGRGGRSDIAGTGPNYDKSNSTLVVEHIPEDKLDENSIKTFFGQFGTVVEVGVQSWKKLATVKFERWDGAKRAYDSPAPIFDNRFVKVFWYKPPVDVGARIANPSVGGAGGVPGASRAGGSPPPQLSKLADEEEPLDMEEFKRKTEEAQKAHEEKMRKKKEYEEKMRELEKKKEELLKMEMEQKRILIEKLAKRKPGTVAATTTAGTPAAKEKPPAKAVSPVKEATDGAAAKATDAQSLPQPAAKATTVSPATDAETEALRAQLEVLEAEAKSLGLDHSQADANAPYYPSRGRGTFRARAVFRGASRGGYHSSYVPPGAGKPYVPGYRGRGGALAPRGRGGAMRLDNRTRRVSVKLPQEGGDEALREYLLGIGEFENIEKMPEGEGAVVVEFKDRMTAEKFVHAGSAIPGIGKVEMAWVNNPQAQPSTPTPAAAQQKQAEITHASTEVTAGENGVKNTNTAVEDYDLADDDEGRWLAE